MGESQLSEQLEQLSLCDKILTNLQSKSTSNKKTGTAVNNGIKDVLLKKCQVYLSLRLYGKALSVVDIYLQDDKSDYKAQCCKIKALLGQGQYQECINFIEKCIRITESGDNDIISPATHITSSSSSSGTIMAKTTLDAQMKNRHLRTLKNQLKDAKHLLEQQKNGFYEMSLFVPNRKVRYDTVAEFKGPVEVNYIAGKGRGMFATDDIPAGTLLVASRAFEVIFDECNDTGTLEIAIAQKLALDPDLAPTFYQLFAGTSLGHLRKSHVITPTVDMERITGICTMNAFGNSRNTSGYGHDSRGLWIFPSFFNHDCIDFNCTWKCLGDFIFVRSVKNVRKGQELLISYTDSAEPYEERVKFFEAHDFLCICKLCEMQRNEDPGVRRERSRILEEAEKYGDHVETIKDINDLKSKWIPQYEKYLNDLEELSRKSSNPEWDFSIHTILDSLCKMYLKTGDVSAYKSTAERYYHIVNDVIASDGQRVCLEVGAAAQVASVFIKAGDFSKAAQWIATLKKDLSSVYGPSDVFRSLYPILHKEAIKNNIAC